MVKGINIYGNDVKVSQFADDTNLFCEDITSVDKALCLGNDFAPVSGLKLNVKKTKVLWLGKWRNNRTTPLQLSWPRDSGNILLLRRQIQRSLQFQFKTSNSPRHVELKEPHLILESFDY